MKKLIFFLLLLFSLSVKATTYYIDADGGNDGNIEGSELKPWRTLLNVKNTMSPGNIYKFKRGGTYYGSLVIKVNNITLDAYGDLNDSLPILDGTTKLNPSWTNVSGTNLYSYPYSDRVINFFNSGVSQKWARTPDIGHLEYESSSSNTITDNELPPALSGSWIGAEIVILIDGYWYGKYLVTGHNDNTLTTSAPSLPAKGQYFLQSHKDCVDSEGEWTYDNYNNNNTIYYYSSLHPNSLNTSVSDNLINTIGIQINYYANVNNLKVFGFSNTGINIVASNTKIYNCRIDATGQRSINIATTSDNTNITKSIMSNSDSYGIHYSGSNLLCESNTIVNIGLIPGKAASGKGQYCGIHLEGNSATIKKNSIRGIGYNGIDIKKNVTECSIQFNTIENFCEILSDGGGIYTHESASDNETITKFIDNNLIINNWPENNTTDIYGIYIDDNCSNFKLENNTLCNCPTGIFIHNSSKINILGNTTYACKNGLLLKRDNIGTTNVTDCIINGNSYINKDENTDYRCIKISSDRTNNDILNNSNNTFNNNYLISPFNNYVVNEDKPGSSIKYTIEDWNIAANVLNDKPLPVAWQDKFGVQTLKDKYIYFYINKTQVDENVTLNATYRDKDGAIAGGTRTIPPLSSEILFAVCVDDMTIPWDINETAFEWVFKAKTEIFSQKKITTNAKFSAGRITLSEGFHAVNGCNFHANSDPCDDSYQSASGYLKSARIQNDMQNIDNKIIDSKPELTVDEEQGVLVYPNPSSGNVTLKLLTAETGNYSVYNSLGKKVKDGQLFNSIETIDLSSCSKGIFLIKIKTTSGVYIKYLIIK